VQEGDVGAGDAIEVVFRPTHGVSLTTMLEALDNDEQARRLPHAGYLPGFWQRVAEGRS
jgi:MOSC domain-containing protein YiiM